MTGVAGQTFLALFIALATGLLLMPIAVTLGAHLKAEVEPRFFRSSRSRRKISYLGGPAVAAAATLAAGVTGGLNPQAVSIVGGGLALLAIGYPDNRRRRSSRRSPAVIALLQAGVATVVWWYAFQPALPGLGGWMITIFLLVGAANAFNLLDNMNGVAGATAAATAGGLAVIAFMGGSPQIAIPVAALCGATAGFLPYNYRRARVYLGAGAPEFIGFVLGASALQVGLYFGPRWAPLAALAALAVPATDTALALLGRVAGGRPVFAGGIDHISHRLFRMGFSPRRAARIHGLAALAATGSVGVALATGPQILYFALAAFALAGIGLKLLEDRETVRSRRGGPALRYLTYALAAVVGLSLPAVLGAAWDLRSARASFNEGRALVEQLDIGGARAAFARGGTLSGNAERKLDWPVTLPARLLPVVGDNLEAAQALAAGGRLIAPAADQALNAADVFPIGPAGLEIGLNQGRLNLEPWPAAAANLADAAAGARLALSDVRAADGILLPPIKGIREDFLREGQATAQALEKASDAAVLLPHFFGEGTPRTWFLMIQNPVELRATGGFLGAFGILRAENGRLTLGEFASNAELQDLDSPVPATEDFARNYDRFYSRTFWRNTNMTPDFPTAARVLSQMWERRTGEAIDGVIAVDAVGLNTLLDIVGPVPVPDIGEINSENFLPLALNEAYMRFPDKDDRTSFLIPVGEQVWGRLLAGNFSDPRSLMVPLGSLVSNKRIQMWSPEELERLVRLDLAGELRPEEGADYLLVVGQNAAGNKVDYYAQRHITYRVDLSDPAEVQGRVGVQIDNGAPADAQPGYIMGPVLPNDPPGLNRTFASVYLPHRATVLSGELNGEPTTLESGEELGLAVASKFLEIQPQTSANFALDTRSAMGTPGHYRLVIQHQPNLNPDRLELQITLPRGAYVYSYSPQLTQVGNRLLWSGPLEQDMELEVRYGSSFRDRPSGILTGF